MKKPIFTLLISCFSFSAQAADRYFVAGKASSTVSTAKNTFDCTEESENLQIINNTVESLKPSVSIDALRNCNLYGTIIHLPKVNLVEDYKTSILCKAFGSRMEISVTAVYQCVE